MNLHPFLSAFPPVLIIQAFVCELILLRAADREFWKKVGRYTLVAALIFTAAAFFSGYFAAEDASQTFNVSQDVIANHHNFGRLLLFALIPVTLFSFLRDDSCRLNLLYLFFLAAALALVLYTGWLGGNLVFRHGAGVFATGNP